MRQIILLVFMAFMLADAVSQSVHIGLYQDNLVTSSVVYCSSGNYHLVAGNEILARLGEGDILYLTLDKELLKVLDGERDFGYLSEVELCGTTPDCVFRIRPLQPELESRVFDDDLVVTASDRFMTLVNRVDMDKYLAGVVEAEAGTNAEKEFYKAQSILCRTYALKNLERHQSEGFSLCDGVHCQAYRGKSAKNPEILTAILETTGLVLADYHYKLITAAYHSNSGGQTQRASDVWLTDTDYLQAVVDPYSLHQPHAKWRDTISFKDWKAYLLKNGMESVRKIPDEIVYVEQMRRKKYFILDKDSIRMTRIREDWGFPSAFFDMFPDGDSVLVWGKGYGHGIGLSQEGAMKMAMDDYTYRDILQFYFHEVRLMDYRDLPASSIPDVEF